MSKRIVTIRLPDAYIKALDELVKKGYFINKSDAIRYAVLSLLRKYSNELSMLYDEVLDETDDKYHWEDDYEDWGDNDEAY